MRIQQSYIKFHTVRHTYRKTCCIGRHTNHTSDLPCPAALYDHTSSSLSHAAYTLYSPYTIQLTAALCLSQAFVRLRGRAEDGTRDHAGVGRRLPGAAGIVSGNCTTAGAPSAACVIMEPQLQLASAGRPGSSAVSPTRIGRQGIARTRTVGCPPGRSRREHREALLVGPSWRALRGAEAARTVAGFRLVQASGRPSAAPVKASRHAKSRNAYQQESRLQNDRAVRTVDDHREKQLTD